MILSIEQRSNLSRRTRVQDTQCQELLGSLGGRNRESQEAGAEQQQHQISYTIED